MSRSLRTTIALIFVCLTLACSTDNPREYYARALAGDHAGVADAGPLRDAAVPHDASASADEDASSPPPPPDAGASDDAVREACGEPPRAEGDFSRERLRSASADCALWHYCAFQTAADDLVSAADAYANDRSPAQLTAARVAFRTAMRLWSYAELFQFGPAASSSQSAGKDNYQGKGFRDRIYAWPATARCRVEEEILGQTSDIASVLISGRGLFAIEYVLFYEGTDTACAAAGQVAQQWARLDPEQLSERKARYAAAVAKDVRSSVVALRDAWAPSGGNFMPSFVSASVYPSEQEAMNVLGWALIYVEREVKDWKVGIPAGYTMTAPVTGPETPFAQTTTDNIRANLHGFQRLFQGCAADGGGIGFDDWLREAGHGDLADEIIAAYGEAQATLDASPQLHEASPEQLETDYQALRKLTNLLKSDLFGAGSPINLKLPASVEGDTD